jgi:hypothetical protein
MFAQCAPAAVSPSIARAAGSTPATSGSAAQRIAHAIEIAMPARSQRRAEVSDNDEVATMRLQKVTPSCT